MKLHEDNFVAKEVDFKVLYEQHKKSPNGKEVYHLPMKSRKNM